MPKDWPEDGKNNPANPNPPTPEHPASPQPAAEDPEAWKKNIDWVLTNPGAKSDFVDSYEGLNERVTDWFRNGDWQRGHRNAFYAVLFAQRHNDAAHHSINSHPGEAITYLRNLGYRADL